MPDNKKKPLEQELAETLRTIYCLTARSPDELEDYFHDSIVANIGKGRNISEWLGHVYRTVVLRIHYGNEAKQYAQLDEDILPAPDIDTELQIDIKNAMSTLLPSRQTYLMEYFYEGYTLDEMAERHGISRQGVTKNLRKALRDMRRVLAYKKGGSNEASH